MDKMAFHALLREQIETASDRLLAEGLAELDRLGVPAPVSIRQEAAGRA
jgi:1-acyl-sn-glycerol-3-phosphate acyltransferase